MNRYTLDSKKETNYLYKPKSFLKKIFIKYPYRLKYVLWNCHFGKLLILLLIIFIIILLIWNNYNINGDYPELSDAEKKQLEDNGEDIDNVLRNYRFLTLLLNICLGLLSGILSIILGVESYKSLLEQRKKGIQITNLSTIRFIRRKFIELKDNILKGKILNGKGESDEYKSGSRKSESEVSKISEKIESPSETSDITIKILDKTIDELVEETEHLIIKIDDIIEDEEKAKESNNIDNRLAIITNDFKKEIKEEIEKETNLKKKTELELLITQLSTLNHSDS
jgi:hypothetical protein